MNSKHLLRGGLVILAGLVAGTLSFNEPAAQQASKLRILQTNFGGDSIQIIDRLDQQGDRRDQGA